MKRSLLLFAIGGVLAHAAAHKPAAAKQIVQQKIWTGSWAAAPMAPQEDDLSAIPEKGVTFRDIVHLSLGGKALRLKISNEFGAAPLMLDSVHVALSAGADATQPRTDHAVTFGGDPVVAISPGAMVVSDPVDMPVAAFANLAVSLFVPGPQPKATLTYHDMDMSTNYMAADNAVAAASLGGAKVAGWYLLKGVDVDAGANAAAVVALGDSITDGAHSGRDQNARWPDVLAARLHANPATAHIGVLNEGIGGNQLLHDRSGENALARLDRDVLAQSGVKYLIVLMGINDIGHTVAGHKGGVTSNQLKWALTQIAMRAHAHGIKVYPATLTPFEGADYQSADGLKMVEEQNEFIRTSTIFDGHIDFNMATRDPAKPAALLPQNDSGDHLHPGPVGYKAMGDSIDLKLFQ